MVEKKYGGVQITREDPNDPTTLLVEILEKLDEILKILKEMQAK